MRRLLFAILISAIAVASTAHAGVAPPKSLAAMLPEAFRNETTVVDDPLEFYATLSTEKAHREGWALFHPYGHNNHPRAVIDKQNGATRFEVRQSLRYWRTRRDYHSAHLLTNSGLQAITLSEARYGVDVLSGHRKQYRMPPVSDVGLWRG